MRKSRTSRPILRSLRLGAAVFVGGLAVWLMWLVGDPAAALRELGEMMDTARVAMVLLSEELGTETGSGGLSGWDRLVLAQSSLLGGPMPSGEPEPSTIPSPEPSPAPELEPPDDSEDSELPLTTTAPEGIIP